MFDETFKDALFRPFLQEDAQYDISVLVSFLEYFPLDKVDIEGGTYDQYIFDLQKTIIDNCEKGNYQVSFFYAHLILMSYTYYCVDHAFLINPDRTKDVFYPINSYSGRAGKPDIENHKSVYDFSIIPEKEIFKVFRALDMKVEKIKELSKYISDRDDYAHATGKGNISIEALFQNIHAINRNMEFLHEIFKKPIEHQYINYLLGSCDVEYSHFIDDVYDFIIDNMLSIRDLRDICNLGLSRIRKDNPDFKKKYHEMRKIHCAFVEYCIERIGIDKPKNYEELRGEAYLFYKYKDNAIEYVEEELKISTYRTVKEGGIIPIFNCIECGEEQLVFDSEKQIYHCFSCGEDFDFDRIGFCIRCGEIMEKEEIEICKNCLDNMLIE